MRSDSIFVEGLVPLYAHRRQTEEEKGKGRKKERRRSVGEGREQVSGSASVAQFCTVFERKAELF